MGKRLEKRREVQVSDKHLVLRGVIAAVLFVVGILLLVHGCSTMDEGYAGWQQIQATSEGAKSATHITLRYDCGQEGSRDVYRAVGIVYDESSVEAWQLFSSEGDLMRLNHAPNRAVTLPEPLYRALALMEAEQSRLHYLGPVQGMYTELFAAHTDMEASLQDPATDDETAAELQELMTFCADPEMVWLELLADNQAILHVADPYLSYAQEAGLEQYLDFGWLTNAFIVDHIAQRLTEAGLTHGNLTSVDGFTRNLDDRGLPYDYNLFVRVASDLDVGGVFTYDQPAAIVFLRDFPLSEKDVGRYYTYDRDRIVTAYLDPSDGMSRTATHSLVGYSEQESCARVALALAPVFIAPQLEVSALQKLTDRHITTLWVEDSSLCYNRQDLEVTVNPDCFIPFTAKYCKP